jgi:hypothetical protein
MGSARHGGVGVRHDVGVEEAGGAALPLDPETREARWGPVQGKQWRVGQPVGRCFRPTREHSNISELIQILSKEA